MQEKEIIKTAQKIEKAGGRLYLVGGAIRDDLLGKKTHDEDYCVTGITAEKFQKTGFCPSRCAKSKICGWKSATKDQNRILSVLQVNQQSSLNPLIIRAPFGVRILCFYIIFVFCNRGAASAIRRRS